jgi:hypothetical protein
MVYTLYIKVMPAFYYLPDGKVLNTNQKGR